MGLLQSIVDRLSGVTAAPRAVSPVATAATKIELRLRMAKAILDFEARRDANGHLKVYNLPAGDGGGEYEVAGINQKYDREMCDRLVAMVRAGKYDEAEKAAVEYIAKNTDPAAALTSIPSLESYLRDCVFNRGVKGAKRILQRALGVEDDGVVGPITLKAMAAAEKNPQQLLRDLRAAREGYERDVAHRGESSKFWKGLVNRWNNALTVAATFPDKPAAPAPGWDPPTPVQVQSPVGGKPAWYLKAEGEIGFHERGVNHGIEKYITGSKCGSVAELDGQPYCAIGVNWSFETSGIPGTRSAMARSFESHSKFVKLDGPAVGAVMTFWRESRASGKGHVDFYAGRRADGSLMGLGFNQSDGVNVAPQDSNRLTGYWWPKGQPLPHTGHVPYVGSSAKAGSEV